MLKDDDFKKLGEQGLTKVFSINQFFKYVNLNDGVEYILKNNTFKFTDPEEFNDPFDCNERMIDIVISPEIEKKFIIEAGKNHNLPRAEIRKQLNRIGDRRQYQQALKTKKKDFKVSCFSEIDDDVLMWSHYADSHKGICIGFNLDIMCADYVFYPVNYINQVQQIDGMANTPYVFYYWVTFKADRWKYEREIRAITKTGQSIINYPKDSVNEVIFGCNVKQSLIDATIKELKKLRYNKIRFYKMEINEKTLLLRKTAIKI